MEGVAEGGGMVGTVWYWRLALASEVKPQIHTIKASPKARVIIFPLRIIIIAIRLQVNRLINIVSQALPHGFVGVFI
jgi:hypothetical protein